MSRRSKQTPLKSVKRITRVVSLLLTTIPSVVYGRNVTTKIVPVGGERSNNPLAMDEIDAATRLVREKALGVEKLLELFETRANDVELPLGSPEGVVFQRSPRRILGGARFFVLKNRFSKSLP